MSFFGIERNKYVAFFLAYLLSKLSLQLSLNIICEKFIGANFTFDTLIIESFFYVLMVLVFLSNNLRITKSSCFFILFYAIVSAVSIALKPETKAYIMGPYDVSILNRYTPRFFLYCFSGVAAISYLDNIEDFFKIFERFSYITILLAAFYYMFSSEYNVEVSYMTFSYHLLLHPTFLMLNCISKFSLKKLFFAVVGFSLIFLGGSRGALVCGILSMIVYLLIYSTPNKGKKISVVLISSLICIFIMFNFESIMESIGRILKRNDISSRTFSLIMKGEFLEDSGRSDIQRLIIDNLNLFGHGIYSDRILLEQSYPHHLLYELYYQYGILFGSIIFLVLCAILIRGILCSNETDRILICSLLSTGFFKLFFSSSYLSIEPGLYVLIGLCIVIRHKKMEGKCEKII